MQPQTTFICNQYLILLQQLHHGVTHKEHVGFLVFAVRDKSVVLSGESSTASAHTHLTSTSATGQEGPKQLPLPASHTLLSHVNP